MPSLDFSDFNASGKASGVSVESDRTPTAALATTALLLAGSARAAADMDIGSTAVAAADAAWAAAGEWGADSTIGGKGSSAGAANCSKVLAP